MKRLIIQVKLSKTKSAKIKVRHGDNPAELAEKFSKIYALDSASTAILTEVVTQSMNDNEVSISELKSDKSAIINRRSSGRQSTINFEQSNDDVVSVYTISDNESAYYNEESDDSYTEETDDV